MTSGSRSTRFGWMLFSALDSVNCVNLESYGRGFLNGLRVAFGRERAIRLAYGSILISASGTVSDVSVMVQTSSDMPSFTSGPFSMLSCNRFIGSIQEMAGVRMENALGVEDAVRLRKSIRAFLELPVHKRGPVSRSRRGTPIAVRGERSTLARNRHGRTSPCGVLRGDEENRRCSVLRVPRTASQSRNFRNKCRLSTLIYLERLYKCIELPPKIGEPYQCAREG